MHSKHPVREIINWDGPASVKRIDEALRRGRAVELELSTKLHDAALSRLVANEDLDAEPVLEVRGGHELVEKLADLEGLESMTRLAEPVREKNYQIALTSSAPVIFIEPTTAVRDPVNARPAVTVPFRTPRTV